MPRKPAEVSYAVGDGSVTIPIRVQGYGQAQVFSATLPLSDVIGKSDAEVKKLAYDQQAQAIDTTLVQWDYAQRRGDAPNNSGLAQGGNWSSFSPE